MAQIEPKSAFITLCNRTETIATAFGHRITPDTIPNLQDYPFARVRTIATDQTYNFSGEGHRKVLLQVDVYDDNLIGADANAELIRSTFSGYIGQLGDMKTGQIKARIVTSNWNAEAQNFWRVIEIEIPTND